jgi:hypothetical protein
MAKSSITESNIQLASKLLRLNAKPAKVAPITEGTPTQALTPDTDATRQKDQDIAMAMNKVGIPVPAGGVPAPNHGEFAMGTQDPMGADEPAHDQPGPGGQDNGMARPEDRRGPSYNAGPGSQTQSEVGGVSPGSEKKFEGTEFEGWSDEELVEAYLLLTGSLEEALWSLITTGVDLEEAEAALYANEVNEAMFTKIGGAIKKAVGGDSQKRSPQDLKKAILAHKQKLGLAPKTTDSKPKFVKREQPWSATKKDGDDARRNK